MGRILLYMLMPRHSRNMFLADIKVFMVMMSSRTTNLTGLGRQRKATPISNSTKKMPQQLSRGVLLAAISSRPGQSGRADGYILEGAELDFYLKKIPKKKA